MIFLVHVQGDDPAKGTFTKGKENWLPKARVCQPPLGNKLQDVTKLSIGTLHLGIGGVGLPEIFP